MVFGIRKERAEGFAICKLRSIFYRLIDTTLTMLTMLVMQFSDPFEAQGLRYSLT